MLLYQTLILAALLGIAFLVSRNHRAYRRPPPYQTPPPDAPRVSVLIPARNEAGNIERCLEGLLQQEYAPYEVLVLDDGSTDDTAHRVEQLTQRHPHLRLLHGQELPVGWAGKAHACWQLAQKAEGEWLLFVDADTFEHARGLIATAVGEAESAGAQLLSTFPRQEIGSLGEALTVPMIFWILFTLLPVERVSSDSNPALVAACGQFLLVRRDAYLATGGHAAIRNSLHDGLHLARRFKQHGMQVRLVDLSALISCRMYHGWRECWSGFSRNLYQALGSVPALLIVSSIELALFLLPLLFLAGAVLSGWPNWAWLVLGQVLILLQIQFSLRARFGYPWRTVALHGVCLGVLLALQWSGWRRSITGGTTLWKGRRL